MDVQTELSVRIDKIPTELERIKLFKEKCQNFTKSLRIMQNKGHELGNTQHSPTTHTMSFKTLLK